MLRVVSALLCAAGLGMDDPGAPAQRPDAFRLHLDVDGYVARALDDPARKDLLHFEERVQVWGKSPQMMLDRFFSGVDLECGATPGGVPTDVEMRAARYHPSPYLDLAALASALGKLLAKPGPPRFFLYRVRGPDGLTYVVRDGPVPQAMLFNTPGKTFELMEGFPDAKSATAAWKRLERGFATASAATDSSPLPPWVTSPCRPRGFR